MNKPSESSNCPICQMPKRQSTAGSLTQWIAVCRCGITGEDAASEPAALQLCSICGKRIEAGRAGSLTQWVFRSDTCQCNSPAPLKEQSASRTKVLEPQPTIVESVKLQTEISGIRFYRELQQKPQTNSFPLERYEPLGELGTGGGGRVFLCRDLLLEKQVAVKTLNNLAVEQQVLFQQEAKATSKLNHPNIVKILDFGVTDSGAPYMVLDVFHGISLQDYIKVNGPPDPITTITVFKRIAEALSYANNAGIFHRDLKPSNILIAPAASFDVRVIDFGVAAFRFDAEQSAEVQGKTLVGTPAFMSPEQVHGRQFDTRSEIYTFGCAMFAALTGSPPFAGGTILETLQMHSNSDPPILAERIRNTKFSPELEHFIGKCLRKEPEDRYQSFDEIIETLEHVAECQSPPQPEVRFAPTPKKSKEEVRRETRQLIPLFSIALAAAVCVIVALIVFSNVLGDFWTKELQSTDQTTPQSKSELPEPLAKDNDDWAASEVFYGAKTKGKNSNTKSNFAVEMVGEVPVYTATRDSLTDDDLKELTRYKDIRAVSVAGCSELTGVGLKYLAKQPKLALLELKWIKLSDEGADALSKLTTLQELNACHVNFQDDRLSKVAKLKNLTILNVCHSAIYKGALKQLNGLKNLQSLTLDGCTQVTVEDLESIRSLPLRRLSILGTQTRFDKRKLMQIFPKAEIYCRAATI